MRYWRALLVDGDSDGAADFEVRLSSVDGWGASFTDVATRTITPLENRWVFNDMLRTKVPLDLLGALDRLRFHGRVEVSLASTSMLYDRVPDGDDVWLALGESPPAPPVLTYSAADLIAAGPAEWDAKSVPSPYVEARGRAFQRDPCVQPADRRERAIQCAVTLALAWREWQRRSDADGKVSQEGFETVLPAYQWMASRLSRKDMRYLDKALLAVDATHLDYVRPAPSRLKPMRAAQQAKRVEPAAMRRMLAAAWLDTLVPVVDSEAWADERGMWRGPASGQFLPSGKWKKLTLVSSCEEGIRVARRPNINDQVRNLSSLVRHVVT